MATAATSPLAKSGREREARSHLIRAPGRRTTSSSLSPRSRLPSCHRPYRQILHRLPSVVAAATPSPPARSGRGRGRGGAAISVLLAGSVVVAAVAVVIIIAAVAVVVTDPVIRSAATHLP
ncbi:Os12g0447155 [Oryza sativa Japonica Group]|uniref:Os12g0447155 protein n=1 Tax=Oryza sativa subsp. japonica TaxID=39947 RepID=A0A0N7KTZ7_ORYSJ|nr:Os12g0447155 [Oryza sativa Japonica Group]